MICIVEINQTYEQCSVCNTPFKEGQSVFFMDGKMQHNFKGDCI